MKIVKKIFRILAIIIASIAILVAIVLIALQTSFVKSKIVTIAEKQVNKMLNAELSVGKLTGTILTDIGLTDILLKSYNSDTIAYIPQISLNYKLLPLLKGEIIVESIIIDKPFVFVEQLADSTWNLQHIMKPSADTIADTTSSAFNMLVQLDMLELKEGNIKIKSINEIIPSEINNLGIRVKGSYSTASQEVLLDKFSFVAVNPDLELKNINIHAKANPANISLLNLLIETAQNSITGKGEYYLLNNNKSFVELNSAPLNFQEFRAFLPDSMQLVAQPVLTMNAEMQHDDLNVNLNLKENDSGIDLKLLSQYLMNYLSDSTVQVTYDVALNISKVDLKHWLNNPQMNYIINGNLAANGKGFDPETLEADLKGNFSDMIVYGNELQKLNLALGYHAGSLNGLIDGAGRFGSVNIKPNASRLMSDNPLYKVELKTNKLNVAEIMGNKEYASNLNIIAKIDGSGFNPDIINAKGLVNMLPSEIMGITIDTLNADVEFIRWNVIINALNLETLASRLWAKGNYHIKGESDLDIDLQIDSIDKIAEFAKIDSIKTSADIKAHVTGNLQDMNATVTLALGNSQYKDIVSLDTLFADIDANIIEMGKGINAYGEIQTDRVTASGFMIDSARIRAESDLNTTSMFLNINSKDINSYLNGKVNMGDTIRAILSSLWFDYKGYGWYMPKDSATVTVAPNEYTVRNFRMVADSAQSLLIDGKVNLLPDAEQGLKMNISNLDIARALNVFNPDMDIAGILGMDVELNGTVQSPIITGNINVDSTRFQNFKFSTFKGDVNYKDNKTALNINIDPKDSGQIKAEGNIPMQIRLDSMLFKVMPEDTDPVYLKLLIEKLPLAIINALFPTDEVSGFAESNITVNGTLGKPNIEGSFNIDNGLVKLNNYGINYQDINIDISTANNAVNIDTFFIRSRTGSMRATGNAGFQSELYNADLNSSTVNIVFNRFNPLDHKYYNMELSGNVDLNASKDSVYFSGDLTIPEMEIFLPALMNLMGQNTTSDIPKPLLVAAMEKDSMVADSVVYHINPDSLNINHFEFLNNLQGNIRIRIPRNTWIKNDDMRFELSGDVELLKHQDFFELFGTVDVVRGQYSMLGKTFVINSGTITFTGGEEINPTLDVTATYSFRDNERAKHDLTIHVTGDLDSPVIKFQMEGRDISEGDALSYILFGMSMDALTSGQQSSLSSGIDALGIGETLAASLISSQLTKLLGNTLNVDYIEFKSGSFDNASFVVGKYITNKLFVSYEQTIGHIEDKDVARYEVTAEYELFKFLFLQLTSSSITNGFDVVFKFNAK